MAMVFDESNFQQEVLGSDLPVMVDFYADWCVPCKMMGPVVEKLAEEYSGKVKIGKLNTDQNQNLAVKYRVMSIPTLLFFKNGELVDTLVGQVSKDAVEAKLKQL